ncbi:MAG: MBL fold metallo-hydrolase, partial [Fimbriimonadaceae bacterium]|nr:MBL fold metallo-hydrolase [Fimbriimonadaceae bacterium]
IQHAGRNILVDAGGRSGSLSLGERLAVPELRRLGVRRLDLILITHPDLDHAGGLAGVVRRMRVGQIASPAPFADRPELREAGRPVLPLASSGSMEWGGAELMWRWMPADPDDNAGSLVVRFRAGAGSVVLTGDAPIEVEERLIPLEDWSAQILKAGHHGSRASTGAAWLEEVRPEWVVISAGRTNRYGHPHPETLERIVAAGARPARTDRDGTRVFRLTPKGFQP